MECRLGSSWLWMFCTVCMILFSGFLSAAARYGAAVEGCQVRLRELDLVQPSRCCAILAIAVVFVVYGRSSEMCVPSNVKLVAVSPPLLCQQAPSAASQHMDDLFDVLIESGGEPGSAGQLSVGWWGGGGAVVGW